MITIQNLCKKFEDKVLFDNFNCSIPDSGFVVFCGESGCGNTGLYRVQRTIPGCCMDYIVTVVG